MNITVIINHTNKTLTFSDNSTFSFNDYEEWSLVTINNIEYNCEIRFDESLTITLYGSKPRIDNPKELEIDMDTGVDISFTEIGNCPLYFFASNNAIVLFDQETNIDEAHINKKQNNCPTCGIHYQKRPFITEAEKTFTFNGEGINLNDGFSIRNIDVVFENTLKSIVFKDDDDAMGYDIDGEKQVKENFVKTQKLFTAIRNKIGGNLSGIEDQDCDSDYYVTLELPMHKLNQFKDSDEFKSFLINIKNNL
jgi:hypothetical protein